MDRVKLLQHALELLLEEETLDAAHAFRSFAEELEEGVVLDTDEIYEMLVAVSGMMP